MNYYVVICCLLGLTASIEANGGLGLGGLVYAPRHASADYYAYPRYVFEYAVRDPHTGDNKAQWERRDGDVVTGAYSLVEPDGSLRVVEYRADDRSGFNAVVKRIGPNLHPATVPAAPIYRAPIPLLRPSGIAAPISIGPVARYSGLASAPLLTGPLGHGGAAISTASLIKAAPIPVVAPVTPILPAPILRPAPLLEPIAVPAPVHPAPLLRSPYLGNTVWDSLPRPILSAPAPVGIPAVGLGEGLLRGPIGGYGNHLGLSRGGYDNYGVGLGRGGSALGGTWGGPLGGLGH